MDTKLPRSGARMSLSSNRSISVVRIPSQSRLSQTCSQGSLRRSVSQLMDIQDKKVLMDDSLWETILGHNSGLVSGVPHPEAQLHSPGEWQSGGGVALPAPVGREGGPAGRCAL